MHVTLSVTDEDFGAVWVESRTLNGNNGSSGITSYSKTKIIGSLFAKLNIYVYKSYSYMHSFIHSLKTEF